MRLVEPGLERQDDEHARDVPGDLAHTIGAPGPYARADEVRDRNADRAEAAREAQVEVRAVDKQGGARPPLAGGVVERVHRLQDPGQRRQDLGDAHHRHVLRPRQRLESGGAHPWPARAKGAQSRTQRLQLAQHRGAVQIGRRLEGYDEQLVQATCSNSTLGPSFSSVSRTRPTSRKASCGGWPRERITMRTSRGCAQG